MTDPRLDPVWLSGALFSPCRGWRYALWRRWDPRLPAVAFLGLNPSTADEQEDDPTIRRCIGFAKRWGCGSLVMLNLYAWRSTDPRTLWTMSASEAIGPENDTQILAFAGQARSVVAAWGAFVRAQVRGAEVARKIRAAGVPVEVLRLSKGGGPLHPLYAPGDLVPRPWSELETP